jgi:hypothetical protein
MGLNKIVKMLIYLRVIGHRGNACIANVLLKTLILWAFFESHKHLSRFCLESPWQFCLDLFLFYIQKQILGLKIGCAFVVKNELKHNLKSTKLVHTM